VIALASDYATAKSAYEEAVKRRPGRLITLRQKTRVIQKSRWYGMRALPAAANQGRPLWWATHRLHRLQLLERNQERVCYGSLGRRDSGAPRWSANAFSSTTKCGALEGDIEQCC